MRVRTSQIEGARLPPGPRCLTIHGNRQGIGSDVDSGCHREPTHHRLPNRPDLLILTCHPASYTALLQFAT